jgi:hypothetical protein
LDTASRKISVTGRTHVIAIIRGTNPWKLPQAGDEARGCFFKSK